LTSKPTWLNTFRVFHHVGYFFGLERGNGNVETMRAGFSSACATDNAAQAIITKEKAMLIRKLGTTGALLLCSAMLVCGGLAATAFGESPCADKQVAKKPCNICEFLFGRKDGSSCEKKPLCGLCAKKTETAACPAKCPTDGKMSADLPPDAEPGNCYTKVIVPADYRTVTERLLTREASEQLEITPAEFKWVEERVMVKEASTRLEAVPAEYKWTEKTIEVSPAHTGWVVQKMCEQPEANAARCDVLCLKTTPAQYKTIRTQCLVTPASVRTVVIPAEYQTIRRQVVATPATTRKVCIAATYEDIQKTVLVCPERVKWERIVCEDKLSADTVNRVKAALIGSGYKPGPINGRLDKEAWTALTSYQQKNRLGVGVLSYETLKQLGVSIQ